MTGDPSVARDHPTGMQLRGYLLAYFFASFSVGIACLGVTLLAARRKGDTLARAFLLFYASLSLMVIGALLRAFIDTFPDRVSTSGRFAVEYLESFVGRYGVMLSLPYFAHRVYEVLDARREYAIAGIVVVAAAIQHVTEFWLHKAWDDRGDVFEDVLFAGIVVYALWLAITRQGERGIHRPLARRFLALQLLALPGIVYDLFLVGDSALRFYPLGYCVMSIVLTWTLVKRTSGPPGTIPRRWGLSVREAEVTRLVQRGLSNKNIADRLNISPNTVKTHLRAIFEKSGVRSRFELISASGAEPFSGEKSALHPDG